jgi:hypothetical protein
VFVFGRLQFATVHQHQLWHAINRDLVDPRGRTKDAVDRADCPSGQAKLRDAGSDALAFTKMLHSLRVTCWERHHRDCGETALRTAQQAGWGADVGWGFSSHCQGYYGHPMRSFPATGWGAMLL